MIYAGIGHPRATVIPVVTFGLLSLGTLCAACGGSSKRDEATEVLAQMSSESPASRYEAVVRLGLLPFSDARREALARAVRDTDARVRLMAGIVVVGDGHADDARWLATPAPTRPSAGPNSTRTPNPARTADLSPIDQLVALDPRFAGTLKPGALSAAQDGDERVCVLGNRALRYMNPGELGR